MPLLIDYALENNTMNVHRFSFCYAVTQLFNPPQKKYSYFTKYNNSKTKIVGTWKLIYEKLFLRNLKHILLNKIKIRGTMTLHDTRSTTSLSI